MTTSITIQEDQITVEIVGPQPVTLSAQIETSDPIVGVVEVLNPDPVTLTTHATPAAPIVEAYVYPETRPISTIAGLQSILDSLVPAAPGDGSFRFEQKSNGLFFLLYNFDQQKYQKVILRGGPGAERLDYVS